MDDEEEFYAFTLTADEELNVVVGLQTSWVGFADPERKAEIRKGRLVFASFSKAWEGRLPYMIVRDVADLGRFLQLGGNALVAKELAEAVLHSHIEPRVCYPDGQAGFREPSMFDSDSFKRAPSPKRRMKVLTRDGRKCRVCGRSPDNYSDIELHVHHIRPWARGGLTYDENLITLCHTCHNGLDPHFDHSLFTYTEPDRFALDAYVANFMRGVANYRKVGYFSDPSEK